MTCHVLTSLVLLPSTLSCKSLPSSSTLWKSSTFPTPSSSSPSSMQSNGGMQRHVDSSCWLWLCLYCYSYNRMDLVIATPPHMHVQCLAQLRTCTSSLLDVLWMPKTPPTEDWSTGLQVHTVPNQPASNE